MSNAVVGLLFFRLLAEHQTVGKAVPKLDTKNTYVISKLQCEQYYINKDLCFIVILSLSCVLKHYICYISISYL